MRRRNALLAGARALPPPGAAAPNSPMRGLGILLGGADDVIE